MWVLCCKKSGLSEKFLSFFPPGDSEISSEHFLLNANQRKIFCVLFIYLFIITYYTMFLCLLQSSCICLACITILMFIDLAIKKNRNRVHLIKPLHLCLINIFQTTGSQLTLYLTAFNGVLEDITTKGHFAFDIWSYSWLLHSVVTSFI